MCHYYQRCYCYLLKDKQHSVGGVKHTKQLPLIEAENHTIKWLIWFVFLNHSLLYYLISFCGIKVVGQCSLVVAQLYIQCLHGSIALIPSMFRKSCALTAGGIYVKGLKSEMDFQTINSYRRCSLKCQTCIEKIWGNTADAFEYSRTEVNRSALWIRNLTSRVCIR